MIVRAVIDMADDLGLRVIAEGVEDRATLQVLASLGCDLAQGYHFSPPVGAAELAGWAAGVGPARLAQPERDSVEAALGERVRRRSSRLAAEEDFLARKRAVDTRVAPLALIVDNATEINFAKTQVTLRLANNLGTQAGFPVEPSFLQRLGTSYGAGMH